jgi:methylase of polypeptide subunit release factors
VSPRLAAVDQQFIALLRQAIRAARYTADGLAESLGEHGFVPREENVPIALRRLGDDPRAILIRLFLLGVDTPVTEAESALPVAAAAACGLVEVRGDLVTPQVQLIPAGDLVFACDRPGGGGRDHVVGPAPSAVLLANLTSRRRVEAALDLGTGSGIQAVAAASHAKRVVATDVNARALEFAEFNTHLNGRDAIEFREGSLYEPVAGERFDLIVCNPPFAVSPDAKYSYRDSGLRGDEMCERLVREAGEHLTEGGVAQFVLSWAIRAGEEPDEPVLRWVEGAGCDALLLRYNVETPLQYAAGWNSGDTDGFEAAVDRWVDYYDELGIVALAYGALTLRRREGPNWTHAEEVAFDRLDPASEHVERLLRSHTYLAGIGDEGELLDGVFALAGVQRLDQTLRPRPGGFEVEGAWLTLEDGLGFRAAVDGVAAELVARVDGRRSLRQVAADVAESLGLEPANAEEAVQPVARRMLELGFLDPGG